MPGVEKMEVDRGVDAASFAKLVTEKQYDVVKTAVFNKAGLVKTTDDSGRTLLHWAASGSSLEFVQFLLDKGCELDKEDDMGWSPLMIASSAGQFDVCRLLVSLDADVTHQNNNKQTPLHYAASKGHVDIITLLLDNGADVNAQDNYGHTPLHRAASKGNTKTLSLLLDVQGVGLNVADSTGNTALHMACEELRKDEVLMLAKHGASLTRENKEKKTPLDLCDSDLKKSLARFVTS